MSINVESYVLEKAVQRFYEKVTADPLLRLYFKHTDVSALQRKFQKYVAYAFADNESAYDGPTIYEAHSGRRITDEAADSFLELLREALTEANLPATTVDKIMAKVSPAKDVVVDKFVFPGTYVYKPDTVIKHKAE